jgi:hypothetical protein
MQRSAVVIGGAGGIGAALVALPGSAAYRASKFGLRVFLGLMRYVQPILRKKGEKGLRRFLRSRGLSGALETRNG